MIAGGLLLVFLASAGFVGQPGAPHHADERLALIADSEDGVSHYDVYRSSQTHNGYLYTKAGKRDSALWQYPPAWHMSAVLLNHSIADLPGQHASSALDVDDFWLATVLTFALFAAGMGVVTAEIAALLGAGVLSAAAAGTSVVLIAAFWHPDTLFIDDFYPQLAAMWLFALAVLLLALPVERIGTRMRIGLVTGLFVATSFTWFFLLPPLGVVMLAWLAVHHREARRHWPTTAIALVLGVGLSIIPTIPALATVGSAINNTGAVDTLPPYELTGLVLLAIAALAACATAARRTTVWVLAIAVGTSVVFSLALREYQKHTTGQTAYFYEKSLYSILEIGILVGAGAIAAVVVRGRPAVAAPGIRARLRTGVVVVAATLAAPVFFGLVGARSTDVTWRYRDGGLLSDQRAVYVAGLRLGPSYRGQEVIAWAVSGATFDDYLDTRWLTAINQGPSQGMFPFLSTLLVRTNPGDLAIHIEMAHHPVTVITADTKLAAELAHAGLPSADLARTHIDDIA